MLIVVVTGVAVVVVVVSFGELDSFTTVVTLEVVVVTSGEVTLGEVLILIVLSTVESVLTSINLGFSVEATAGLRASVGFNP